LLNRNKSYYSEKVFIASWLKMYRKKYQYYLKRSKKNFNQIFFYIKAEFAFEDIGALDLFLSTYSRISFVE
jgi:hypothetical protein